MRRWRRVGSALWLALLLTLNTIQPTLALAHQPAPQAGIHEPTVALAGAWHTQERAQLRAHYLANEPSGTITNTVTVNSSTIDPNTLNNTATQTTTVTSQADLLISKDDGVTSALPGTVITYTIVVTNAGPSAVANAAVADTLPAEVTGARWTCRATDGSRCAEPGGTGDLATTVDLAVNGAATYTVVATLAPTASGTVANTATVNPPVNTVDPNGANNSDTDTDTLLTGILTGTVYLDADGNALYADPEGLDGITVVITTSVGYVFTTTTDANGRYTETVPAGATVVDVVGSELPVGVAQIEGDDPTTVTVAAGGSAGSVDGYEQQGQVTGHIYQDTDGDGNQGVGEPNLSGVTVLIIDTFGVTRTVTTDVNGNYTATVPIGDTTADVVEATLPAGSVQTAGTEPTTVTATAGTTVSIGIDGYQPQGVVQGTLYMDENGDGIYTDGEDTPLPAVRVTITDSNGITYSVTTDASGYFSRTVPSGSTVVDVENGDLDPDVVLTGGGTVTDDTGYVLLASIGDYLWLDLNADGAQDGNEPGLAGVEVALTLPNGGTRTATTGPNGYYTFDDLVPGNYTVAVVTTTLPADVVQTYDPDSTQNHRHTVTIASDDRYEAADFGYQGSASIGDLIWLDSNGNGNRDLSEIGIAGVMVTLTMANGWEITTTTTGAGSYDFGGLIGGIYTVTVDAAMQPTGTLPTGAQLTTANQPLTVTLGSTQDYNLADFGYQRQALLTGHLFEDTDGNGVQNGSEPPLAGVRVLITDSLGLTQTVVTDATGNYTATVPVDSTTAPTDEVIVDIDERSLPAGAVQTAGTDPDPVTVTAGDTTDAGNDGYQIQGLVQGVVYTDVNQNGSYDSGTDTPLVGVEVTITDSNGVADTITTDAAGFFSRTVPAGNTAVNVDDGDIAGLNPNLMIENGFTDPDSVTVPGGGVGTTNFPYVEPLTIDKDVTTPNVVAGTEVRYQIVVRNIGGLALTNVTISDTLPVSFTFASATFAATGATRTAGSEPRVGDPTPVWGSWTINPGGQVTISFVAKVGSDVPAGLYDNTAAADSDQTGMVDDNGSVGQDANTPLGGDPENDEDVTVTTAADLAITKLDDPDPVVAGTLLTYTIQLVNNGPSDAQDVVVADNLSPDTSFVSADATCSAAAGVVTCNLGTVPNGESVTVTIVVTVTPDLLADEEGVAAVTGPAATPLALTAPLEVAPVEVEPLEAALAEAEPLDAQPKSSDVTAGADREEVSRAGGVEVVLAASPETGQPAGATETTPSTHSLALHNNGSDAALVAAAVSTLSSDTGKGLLDSSVTRNT